MNFQWITLRLGEKLREIATRQGNVPFDKGDLRKAHVVEPHGSQDAIVSANTPYARAVHDGRPAITIKPKKGKALHWKGAAHPVRSVKQPARKGDPWLQRAADALPNEHLGFVTDDLGDQLADAFTDALRSQGLKARRK